MKTDKRADTIFRKQYHLKGKQVEPMRDTFNYQATVLRLYLGDLWLAIKSLFGYCPKCGTKLFTWSYGKYKCDKCKKTYYS